MDGPHHYNHRYQIAYYNGIVSLRSSKRAHEVHHIQLLQHRSSGMFASLVSCLVISSATVLASVDLLVVGDWGGMPVKPYTMPGEGRSL
jgi:hypothetical protein